jgi:serine/threonine protein kinase
MAIKEIQLKQSMDELKNEIDILKKFNHNNVVKYFGSLVHGQKIWVTHHFKFKFLLVDSYVTNICYLY